MYPELLFTPLSQATLSHLFSNCSTTASERSIFYVLIELVTMKHSYVPDVTPADQTCKQKYFPQHEHGDGLISQEYKNTPAKYSRPNHDACILKISSLSQMLKS